VLLEGKTLEAGSLADDALFRFVRQYQVAAGLFLDSCNYIHRLNATWQTLESLPTDWYERHCATRIASDLVRLAHHVVATPHVAGSWDSSASRLTCLALENLLHAHRAPSTSLNAVAEHLRVSSSHLSRAVRSASGRGLPVHLGGLRLLSALCALEQTDLLIRDVAAAAGYHHTGELDRDTHIWVHVTPKMFRRILRQHRFPRENYGTTQFSVSSREAPAARPGR
jgi:AraC-like DNA-binding protein